MAKISTYAVGNTLRVCGHETVVVANETIGHDPLDAVLVVKLQNTDGPGGAIIGIDVDSEMVISVCHSDDMAKIDARYGREISHAGDKQMTSRIDYTKPAIEQTEAILQDTIATMEGTIDSLCDQLQEAQEKIAGLERDLAITKASRSDTLATAQRTVRTLIDRIEA